MNRPTLTQQRGLQRYIELQPRHARRSSDRYPEPIPPPLTGWRLIGVIAAWCACMAFTLFIAWFGI